MIPFATLNDLPGTAPNEDGGFPGTFSVINSGVAAAVSSEVGLLFFNRFGSLPGAWGFYGTAGVPIFKLGAAATAQGFLIVDAIKLSKPAEHD